MPKPKKDKSDAGKPLGHGSHWEALGFGEADESMAFLGTIVQHSSSVGSFDAPWPGEPCKEIVQLELPQGSLLFASIVGRQSPDESFEMLSAFPVLTDQAEWIVRVDRVLDSYGAVEGVVEGETASGHPLQWFAPRFAFEAVEWRASGLMRVAFAALALRVSRYDAKPIIVTEGPLLEMRREELRKEGKASVAERADLSIEVFTDGIRTFFTSNHDHHEFVGKVKAVRAIRPRPEFHGMRIDLECLPDEIESGYRLPLYVFPPALQQGFLPKRGDLLQGVAWLQGTWKSVASPDDVAAWHKAGGKPLLL